MNTERDLAEMIVLVGTQGNLPLPELRAKIETALKTFGDSRYTQGYNDSTSDAKNRRKS